MGPMTLNKFDPTRPLHIFCLLLVLLFFKLLLSLLIPLFPDEAYYWVWSLKPQLSYYDHPPFASWLLGFGSYAFELKEIVRWPAIVFGHLACVVWYFIFKELGVLKKYPLWLLLTLASPLLGIGSLIVTPDLPLLVFWSLAVLFFMRLIKYEKNSDALYLGLSLGLGFVSKYMMALFIPIVFIYLIKTKTWGRQYLKFFFIVTLTSFVASFPVFYWNYLNDFVSFRFQLNHGLHEEIWDWRWPLDYVLGQAVVLVPFITWAFIKKPGNSKDFELLKLLFLGPLVFFFITSFRAHVELNWPVMALPSFFALVAASDVSIKKIKLFVASWVVVYIFLGVQIFSGYSSYVHGKIQEAFLYKKWAQTLAKDYQPLYAINYQLASSFWFYTGQPVYKLSQASRYDFFEIFKESRPLEKEIYVIKQAHNEWPKWMEEDGWRAETIKKLSLEYGFDKVIKE